MSLALARPVAPRATTDAHFTASTAMSRLSDEALHALLATLPQGLALVETSGTIVFANRRAHAALGTGGRVAGRAVEAELARVLQDAGAAGAAYRLPLAITRGRTLRVQVLFIAEERAAVVIRSEEIRTADIERALASLRLGPGYARLAVRVYRGWTNRAIAEAFGIPVGRVKWRLAQLFLRVGVRRRAALTWAIDRLLGQRGGAAREPAPAPRGEGEADVMPGGPLAPAVIRDLRRFLQRVNIGLAAIDDEGELVGANPEARRLLAVDAGPAASRPRAAPHLARVGARVAAGATPTPRTLTLDGGAGRLRVTLWQVRPGLAGVRLHREQLREADALATLGGQFGLSPPQARAALLLGGGASLADVGRALGTPEGTVRSMSGTIYTKLGVHSRTELAALLRDLGAAPARGRAREDEQT
ncbi:MAG TPA: PAS domain-containing protein [Polyangia bacterium]|jgi:DNA-binding CsgD family transcriptional regulator/PAS domain-containing protein